MATRLLLHQRTQPHIYIHTYIYIYIYIYIYLYVDLSNNTYKPFIKTDQSPSYININSNHPKAIIKQVPKAVNLRIRNLSANEEIFRKGSKMYIDALKSSGYKENFTYKEEKMPNDNKVKVGDPSRG